MTISGFWCMMIAFGCFLLFGINLKAHNNDRMETLYSVGAGMMGLGIFQDIVGVPCSSPGILRIIFGILAAAAFVALIYCTFVAGKRTKWGRNRGDSSNWWKRELADTGIYALCRHPAVVCWWILLLSLVICTGFKYFNAIYFGLLGLLLAIYDDRAIYPVITPGYENYKTKTPFLFPNRGSTQRCKDTWGKGKSGK